MRRLAALTLIVRPKPSALAIPLRCRMKNILLFVGAILGTVFLVAGIGALGRHDRTGWLYLVLALFCALLAADPGGRLRRLVVRRPNG